MHSRSLRRTRRRTTASRLSLAAAAALVLAVPLATPASADPSDQPGGTTAVLESDALDRLQQRAAEVQTGLQEQQDEVVAARAEMDAAEAGVASGTARTRASTGAMAAASDSRDAVVRRRVRRRERECMPPPQERACADPTGPWCRAPAQTAR